MSDIELHTFFGFDDADLNENRLGRISAKQMERLQASAQATAKYFWGLTIFILLVGAFISYTIIKAGGPETTAGLIMTWLFLGVFIVIFVSIARAKPVYELASVEGEVNFVKVEKTRREKSASGSTHTRTYQVYELRIGRVKFHDVDEELLNIMKEGDIYLFYYLKDTSNILSAEFISKGK